MYSSHGIKHDVDASTPSDLQHLLLPIGARVVDNMVRAAIALAYIKLGL